MHSDTENLASNAFNGPDDNFVDQANNLDDQILDDYPENLKNNLPKCIVPEATQYNQNTKDYDENKESCEKLRSQNNNKRSCNIDDVYFSENPSDTETSFNDDPDYIPVIEPIIQDIENVKSNKFENINLEENKSDQPNFHITADDVENLETERKTKKTNVKLQEGEWNRNEIKKLRMSGKAYNGYKRSNSGVITQGIPRPQRKISETCKSVSCIKSTKHFCQLFSEDYRLSIFTKFWNMESWEQKKGTYFYHLRTKDNERKRVCKKMFLGTLGLKEDMVHDWIGSTEHGLSTSTIEEVKSSRTRSDNGFKN
ncbi:unnamed protein product [Psylliodes chrysocephalus]|uniref:Uncharacterized protein n=1 Tax=Psylliodes chrysocephalus TaxID=3402493 RepID=A0A9P0D2C1_9CUCU|nr:unnamed protein product [Psylliodes chrysocephala]